MSDSKSAAPAGGTKDDSQKVRTDLLPVRALTAIAEVLTDGAVRYGERNWEKGLKWSRVYGAILRHVWAWWRGEDLDPDSGRHHLAHAGCEVLFALEFVLRGRRDLDDRPEPPIEVSGGTEPAPPIEVSGGTEPAPLPGWARCGSPNRAWPRRTRCECVLEAGHKGNHRCIHEDTWPQS